VEVVDRCREEHEADLVELARAFGGTLSSNVPERCEVAPNATYLPADARRPRSTRSTRRGPGIRRTSR
jgi:hypothetical protein